MGRFAEKNLLDRLLFIKRKFSHTLLIGACGLEFEREVLHLGHGENQMQNIMHKTSDTITNNQTAWQSIDLIVSNLHLQSVNDVPGIMWQIKNLLKPDGLFLASFLGGDTLKELKASFMAAEMILYGGASARVSPMIDLYSASQLLTRADFKLPVADHDVVHVEYENLNKLMQDLRAMGLTNVLHNRLKKMDSRLLFQYVEDYYHKNFSQKDGLLKATFEIINLTGWKYHESQQKALKPGSAKVSLASVIDA